MTAQEWRQASSCSNRGWITQRYCTQIHLTVTTTWCLTCNCSTSTYDQRPCYPTYSPPATPYINVLLTDDDRCAPGCLPAAEAGATRCDVKRRQQWRTRLHQSRQPPYEVDYRVIIHAQSVDLVFTLSVDQPLWLAKRCCCADCRIESHLPSVNCRI